MTLSRRQFIFSASLASAGLIVHGDASTPQPVLSAASVHLLPAQTALFQQHKGQVPLISAEDWSLRFEGLVENPFTLDYARLKEFPAQESVCALGCISDPPGGRLLGEALWRGVPLQALIARAGMRPEAQFAHLHASDGYVTSIRLLHLNYALLAYAMNGAPLRPEHGFPARLLVPGLYGYKMPKWVKQIVFSAVPLAGFWESQGWSPEGVAQTMAAIRSVRQNAAGGVTLSGVAYAGARTLRRVEISVDGGAWMPVLCRADGVFALAHWQIDWMPPGRGAYVFKVRASDSSGYTQSEQAYTRPFPNGTSALHAAVVRVEEI